MKKMTPKKQPKIREIKKEYALINLEFPFHKLILFSFLIIILIFCCLGAYEIYIKPGIESRTNYIQASHTDVKYYEAVSPLTGEGNICIKNVKDQRVVGSSMQPTTYTGNTILVKNFTSIYELKEGMIITYVDDKEGVMAHRVKGVYPPDYVITQGDASNYWQRVNYDNITGIVVGLLFT